MSTPDDRQDKFLADHERRMKEVDEAIEDLRGVGSFKAMSYPQVIVELRAEALRLGHEGRFILRAANRVEELSREPRKDEYQRLSDELFAAEEARDTAEKARDRYREALSWIASSALCESLGVARDIATRALDEAKR